MQYPQPRYMCAYGSQSSIAPVFRGIQAGRGHATTLFMVWPKLGTRRGPVERYGAPLQGAKDLGLVAQAKISHFVATSTEAQRALEKRFQKLRMQPNSHARNLGHASLGSRAKRTSEKKWLHNASGRELKWRASRPGVGAKAIRF
eukprot:8779573-Pyramimonas_sp.AAC.1